MRCSKSLTWKMTVIYILFVIIGIGVWGIFLTETSRTSQMETVRDELKTAAGIMATQVNTSALAALRPGDEGSPLYFSLAEQLASMRSGNDLITNAYIMKVSPDQRIEFLVDDLWIEDPAQSAFIGEVYDSPDRREIFLALSVPTASRDFYRDRWGEFLSGYAPIRDTDGNTVAVLGIDVEASSISDRIEGIGLISIIIAGLILLSGWVPMYLFTRAAAGDIRTLRRAVGARGEERRKMVSRISRNDEIGELSRAIEDRAPEGRTEEK